jgi:curved DNA-binding protein CbpA
MNDPYKVLGVSPDATDEQLKSAYRELARKYHPDNYQDSPLADLANEKMKEINEAYDRIQAERLNARSGGRYQGGQFSDILRLIQNGRITEAEELLDGVPAGSRDAQWHFLKGQVLYSRGWLEASYEYFQRAAAMEPDNIEYRTVLNQISNQRRTGMPYGSFTVGGNRVCTPCDICTALVCASSCSSCFRCCL